MLKIMNPFTKANLKYFELSEKAKEWIINEVNANETIIKKK
jgi:hypothetical protein